VIETISMKTLSRPSVASGSAVRPVVATHISRRRRLRRSIGTANADRKPDSRSRPAIVPRDSREVVDPNG
jgi:hypothetical protein